jgi:hypothetical protein
MVSHVPQIHTNFSRRSSSLPFSLLAQLFRDYFEFNYFSVFRSRFYKHLNRTRLNRFGDFEFSTVIFIDYFWFDKETKLTRGKLGP